MPVIRVFLLLSLAFASTGELHAQLRPWDTIEWDALGGESAVRARFGVELFEGQAASLAGTEGRLWELGRFALSWRVRRGVVIDASGTLLRGFVDGEVLRPPYGGARTPSGEPRWDAGDYRLSTLVRLTPTSAPAVVLRFGTRLPTTDNRVGLERDRVDFFALVGGRLERDGWWGSAESGVGIHGTRRETFEQSDVWVYALEGGYRWGAGRLMLQLAGHMDGLPGRSIRGNENLQELRARLRLGRVRWVELGVVGGIADFSPRWGASVAVGRALF